MATQGGAITVTTGAGGILTANSEAAFVGFHSLDHVNGGNGNITINTNHVVLNASTDDIVAGTGVVTIQAVTAGQPIQLGTGTDAELDLSSGSWKNHRKPHRRTNAGNITVTAALSFPGIPLWLQTGGSISASGSGNTISIANLAMSASTGIASSPTPLSTQIANLSALTGTGDIVISNFGNLSISGGVLSGENGESRSPPPEVLC